MVDPISVGYNANRWLFDSDTKFISLFNDSDWGTKSLHSTANVDYLVPVGKKFVLLAYRYNGTTQSISYDTSADTVGTKVWFNSGNASIIDQVWVEIPASNYINVTVVGSTTQGFYAGIETTT